MPHRAILIGLPFGGRKSLARLYREQGRRTEAARRYAIFRTRTLREFGEEPDFQLADLRPAARISG